MGIFRNIKRSLTACDDIDEKIEYLNKELEKTGLHEMMTTDKIYQSGNEVTNTDFSDFEALSQNGYGLGVSGADGNGAGGAYVGKVIASEHGLTPGLHDFVLNLDDVAVSPPHPQGGQRRYASTVTGIGGAFSPLRPGKIQAGSLRGGALWFFDPNYNFSGQVGRWLNFEWHPSAKAWGFYDTSVITGSTFLNPNIDQYELNGVNIGQQIKDKIAGINFGDNGAIGAPKTIVLTQNRLDDVGFLPINIDGLSVQGYNYLKGKSGIGQLRAGTKRKTRRGVGAKTRSVGKQLIPYGKGGRVSGRGVGKYITSRGVELSPSSGRVARNVASQLPPKPTPAEIRNTTVAEFRKNGDNLAANKFYTEDRIAELESKSELSSSEQSELKQLKVQAVYQNLVTPENNVSVADQQSEHDTAAEEQSEKIFNKINSSSSEISTALDNILSSSASSELSETEREAISSFSKALASGEEITPELFSNLESTPEVPPTPPTPKPKPTEITSKEKYTFPDGTTGQVMTMRNGDKILVNDKGEVVERNGLSTEQNKKITQSEKLRNSIDIAKSVLTNSIVEHKPSEQAIEQFKNNLTVDDISLFQFNTQREGYSDGNLFVTYDENGNKIFNGNRDGSGNQGANNSDLSIEFNNLSLNNLAAAAHGKPNGQVVLPSDGSEGYVLLEKYAYHNTSTTNPFSQNFDPTELPNWQTGIMSGLVHLAANTPQGKALQTISDLFSKITGSDSKLPEFLNGYGIHGMAHHELKVPLSELPADVLAEIQKNENYDAYENSRNQTIDAERYPPPKQWSTFEDEDGNLTQYYTYSIFEGDDGKTYKSVLQLPQIDTNADGTPYFGSIYSPSAYRRSIPLFDTGMDDLIGEYIPPDDLPKIPFTPPEPKNESYISESVKLGHFDPEVLNVDIEKLRKGIMPEFPKDPPPEMIDGYSAKSKLAPKTIEGEPFLNITKKDLAKNHRFTDKEISEFMDEINAINDYIRKNPAELKYAMIRYPKDDPRLAQLNWQMDQKLSASKEYMDKHYPENQKLFSKIQKSIKKNIELTDPKSFKGVKIPKFEGVDLTDHKRRKAVVSRHYKKAVKIRKLFSRKKT